MRQDKLTGRLIDVSFILDRHDDLINFLHKVSETDSSIKYAERKVARTRRYRDEFKESLEAKKGEMVAAIQIKPFTRRVREKYQFLDIQKKALENEIKRYQTNIVENQLIALTLKEKIADYKDELATRIQINGDFLRDSFIAPLKEEHKELRLQVENRLQRQKKSRISGVTNKDRNRLGRYMEDIAAYEVDNKLIPEIAQSIAKKEKTTPEKIKSELYQLRNVTIANTMEFDHIIVRVRGGNKENIINSPEVVGIVETKVALSDIPGAFRRLTRHMKVLSGAAKMPNEYHELAEYLDNINITDKSGKTFVLTKDSFRNLNPAGKHDWEKYLFFITIGAPPTSKNLMLQLNSKFFRDYSHPNLQNNLLLINRKIGETDLPRILINTSMIQDSRTLKK